MSQATPQRHLGAKVLIALGSNRISPWGDPAATIQKAMDMVAERTGARVIASPLYVTPAYPAGAGPDFVNAAIRLKTAMQPHDVLAMLHRIEEDASRERSTRWGQRTLDLDLIAYGDDVLPDLAGFSRWRDLAPDLQAKKAPDQLILPHPRLQDRAFVLVPLADVAPDWVHPVSRQSVAQMRDARPRDEIRGVVRFAGA